MPRYMFHVRKDDRTDDTTGVELDGPASARMEAVVRLAQEMKDSPATFWNDEEWHVEVTDAHGLILFTVYSSAIEAAASIK